MSNNAVLPKNTPVLAGSFATALTAERSGTVITESENALSGEGGIQQQLDRILQSSLFVQSQRLSRFLQFIVEETLAGNQSQLKEYAIGAEAYNRRPPYHPSHDSIVRTEARRLRGKLKEYYETQGKNDPVYIYLRLGSYIPVFQSRAAFAGIQKAASSSVSARVSPGVIAILPFLDISRSIVSSKYARGIPDELAFTLGARNCVVMLPLKLYSAALEHSLAAAMSEAGAQIAFGGSVREENNHVRVTARIVDGAGFQLWATRFDADAAAPNMFVVEEQIAAALIAGYNSLFGASLHY